MSECEEHKKKGQEYAQKPKIDRKAIADRLEKLPRRKQIMLRDYLKGLPGM
ncbi:hypothetical protein LJC49_03090 [Ruminococcaceae bacterium OttesenSCG-928-I18]|nr:hypothetical protein [Ruminococcaceae bacterium OttesenSCG-928-I18]